MEEIMINNRKTYREMQYMHMHGFSSYYIFGNIGLYIYTPIDMCMQYMYYICMNWHQVNCIKIVPVPNKYWLILLVCMFVIHYIYFVCIHILKGDENICSVQSIQFWYSICIYITFLYGKRGRGEGGDEVRKDRRNRLLGRWRKRTKGVKDGGKQCEIVATMSWKWGCGTQASTKIKLDGR